MDGTGEGGHAYRCLPLNIANAHGWFILNPAPFEAEWNGTASLSAVTISPIASPIANPIASPIASPIGNAIDASTAMPADNADAMIAESHFGSGVLTFHVKGLFRTDPGYDLMVTGPVNMPKDAIQPLSGVVETDWANFSFTMNWIFTRPGVKISFARDEPFCMIYPVKRGMIEAVHPEIRPVESEPDIHDAFAAWSESRRGFNRDLRVPGSEARDKKWQKDYFRGDTPFAEGPADHRTKLRPRPFRLAPRWKEGGLMDRLVHEQTEANRIGRRRMNEGILTPGPCTVVIDPARGGVPDGLDFLCQPDFLSARECALLAEATRALTRVDPGAADDEDFLNQVALFPVIARDRRDAAALLRVLRPRIAEALGFFHELTMPVFTDSLHLMRWSEGMSMDPCAVRAHPDGSPHPAAFRDFASILWLNDDFEGGDVYFPRLDLVVKPCAGLLLAFTAGWHHEHGVTEITRGEQVTIPGFHTYTPAWRDRALHAPDDQPAQV